MADAAPAADAAGNCADGVPPRTVTLASQTDFDGFRNAARALAAGGVAPQQVHWAVGDATAPELFDVDVDTGAAGKADVDAGADASANATANAGPDAGAQPGAAPASAPKVSLRVPPDFLALCRDVVLHSSPTRFALLYSLLWRLQHEPALRHDTLDAEMAQARGMAQAVRRDMHKMKAFVRFREVQDSDAGANHDPASAVERPRDGVLHVAWFEPGHHIVEAVAPFFVRRFAGMRFAILTPERSLRWDGRRLQFGPGAGRHDAPPADAGEALWLTYYASIFNPARLKLRAMEKEMPRRYWNNLPEADLISGLAASAHERSARMVEQAPTKPARRLPSQLPGRLPGQPPRQLPPVVGQDASAVAGQGHGRHAAASMDSAAALTAQRQAAAGCRECPLGEPATQTVWGEGPVHAALMLVGEQPGDQEDLQGRPFVGPAGQLLARAMAQLGWPRDAVYITNAVKHFKYEPRGKRRIHKTPAQREADACLHWLESEIALVQPQAVVALGATAARQLMGRPVAVMRERGQWLARADGVPVLVTLHPSALLRAEPADREAGYAAWIADLQHASRQLTGTDAGGVAGGAVPGGRP